MERPSKRARVSADSVQENTTTTPLASLHRSITPPSLSRSGLSAEPLSAAVSLPDAQSQAQVDEESSSTSTHHQPRLIPSPIQLTHIQDFPANKGYNVDTVRLRDILGDPMIRECWQFNYLFDVDFLISQFDEDVRGLVKVKVVHGSWQKDSVNGVRIDVSLSLSLRCMHWYDWGLFDRKTDWLQEACTRYPNVEAIVAYMPERFGTHHSKMMILLRHDNLAQLVSCICFLPEFVFDGTVLGWSSTQQI